MKILLSFISLLLIIPLVHAQDPAYPTAPAAPQNIVRAEYFFDVDPGIGNGTTIDLTSPAVQIEDLQLNIPTTGLGPGIHRLYIRTLSNEGKWSIANRKEFMVDIDPAYPATPANSNIISAEYFIDSDPGMGNGTTINLPGPNTQIENQPLNIPVTALGIGFHRLYIRTLSHEGKWSVSNFKEFLVDADPAYPVASANSNIVSAEYFIDTDPGFGNGEEITITNPDVDIAGILANINLTGLPNGIHRIYLRTSNAEGKWSQTSIRDFDISADFAYPVAAASPGNITRVEYFIDNDPGFGNGVPVTITNAVDINNISVNVGQLDTLNSGPHFFYIRSLDDWSITSVSTFMKEGVLPLHFISFSAVGSGDDVLLNWITENEVNTASFDIEYSRNGISFEKIGAVSAVNAGGRHHYSFTHENVQSGRLFYRIKQIDIDGKFEYSRVVAVIVRDMSQVLVYPNPAQNFIRIRNLAQGEVSQLSIYSMKGELLKRFNPGQSQEYDIRSLRTGVYQLLILMKDGTSIVHSFIKE